MLWPKKQKKKRIAIYPVAAGEGLELGVSVFASPPPLPPDRLGVELSRRSGIRGWFSAWHRLCRIGSMRIPAVFSAPPSLSLSASRVSRQAGSAILPRSNVRRRPMETCGKVRIDDVRTDPERRLESRISIEKIQSSRELCAGCQSFASWLNAVL
jgi:hypothetical protein